MRVSVHTLQEDREHQKLVVSCRCGYQEDVDPSRWCVYRNEVHHTSKERTVILRVSQPTLGPVLLHATRRAPHATHTGRSFSAQRRWTSTLLGADSCYMCVLQDVRADPTLPRTRDVRCPSCSHNEAVFFSASTEEVRPCSTCYVHGHAWCFAASCSRTTPCSNQRFQAVQPMHIAGHDALLQLHQLQPSVARLRVTREHCAVVGWCCASSAVSCNVVQ